MGPPLVEGPAATPTPTAPILALGLSESALSGPLIDEPERTSAPCVRPISGWLAALDGSDEPDSPASMFALAAAGSDPAVALADLDGRPSELPLAVSGDGSDGRSSVEGHSSIPIPGPGPGGSGGGSAAGGAAASASSASFTLVSLFLRVPPGVTRRLRIAPRSGRETFFFLIPERPG